MKSDNLILLKIKNKYKFYDNSEAQMKIYDEYSLSSIMKNFINNYEELLHNIQRKYSNKPVNSNNKQIIKKNFFKDVDNIINYKEKFNETYLYIKEFFKYSEECLKNIYYLKFHENRGDSIDLPLDKSKKIAFFNLDNTLIKIKKNLDDCDKIINLETPAGIVTFGFKIRPNLIECMNDIKKYYNIVIFTASEKIYADSILDCIDPDGELFDYRLYRNNCFKVRNDTDYVYIKDLRIIKNFNIKDMVIIDHSVFSFLLQIENGIPIQQYDDNKEDNEFIFLRNYLIYLSKTEDIQNENNKIIKLSMLREIENKQIYHPENKTINNIKYVNNSENINQSILNEGINLSNEYSFSISFDDSFFHEEFLDLIN